MGRVKRGLPKEVVCTQSAWHPDMQASRRIHISVMSVLAAVALQLWPGSISPAAAFDLGAVSRWVLRASSPLQQLVETLLTPPAAPPDPTAMSCLSVQP